MKELGKTRFWAKVFFVLTILFFLVYTLNMIGKTIGIPGVVDGISLRALDGIVPQGLYFMDTLSDIVVLLVFLVCFNVIGFFAASLLRSVWTEESPFQMANVRRLKLLALALLLFGPICEFACWLQLRVTGDTFFILEDLGDALFLCYPMAVIAYILALVFQYGVVLQTQADETL